MQYPDIILNFDSSVVLGAITDSMKQETVSESLIAVNLLSLIIHSDIEFDFDFAPLIDLAELKDTKLESAALFCLSELVLKNSEILNQCLERNIIQIAESKANSPSIVQKEAIRLLAAFICGMTRSQMENYISPVSMKLLLQGLDYDDSELLKSVIQAMDCIFRPKCGDFFNLFYSLFLECDGWTSINSMMCNYDDHSIQFLSTAFYHNYSDIESLNEE
ncbi:hypothetical protein TVAG_388080 [Trichomonas vaginalis G3]|uniref:Uncharacterized protein n=1 Tax=Trichomonas vaginalis (strain ATCC PRA-98 / G3) TaxID=412133 RepID=A2E135_TRIV3|nr:hypothetical protein TVAGG3_0330750 [Trichomonas vaginalis G3]EAY13667.1 hypothetical protein TVAG_388080 [Trichomonas vaginalis G3]KAI5529941.1 hypothetical protein TVAGG3_0330750 [Trichomonas vaginalis G3]|eukprot:XP_001325890.1 hypothetical protein [Trichomonas vaginalis G3]